MHITIILEMAIGTPQCSSALTLPVYLRLFHPYFEQTPTSRCSDATGWAQVLVLTIYGVDAMLVTLQTTMYM